MRLFFVAVRDSAADSFHAPLCFPAIGMAERWFRDECNAQSEIAKHVEDYELHLLGAYITETAEIVVETPRLLLRGVDAVRKPS